MELYKGYIRLSGKKSTDKIKDVPASSFRTLENAKTLKSYGGVLADDTILIDLDDSEQSEILMNIVEDLQLDCKVIQTTRGKHFLFKNTSIDKCYTHVNLACGLVADIKVGCKTSYEVLKVDDAERFVEWDIEEGQEYQEIPKWMHPVKSDIDFVGMDAGDGRNQSLFNYILTLQSNGFSKEDVREIIDIINQYVLKEPLSEDEIKTITRDEAFKKELFFVKNTFQHDKFARFMVSQCHIKRINCQLHMYRKSEGVYVSGYKYIENAMIEIIPTLKSSQRIEVLKYLEVLLPDDESVNMNFNYIAFRNGIYDRKNNVLLPFSPEHVITNKIPWDYNPTAYSEIANVTLNKISCNDLEIRSLLEECIGYCFYRKNTLQKSFILTGNGANGKSTYLDTLKNILGKNNHSQLDIGELDDRFSTVMMSGKLANIGDDISSDYLEGKTLSVFKKTVTGNGIKGENKGQDGFFFEPYTKLLFSANEIPRMKSRGFDAIKRRLIIIPFNAKFSKDDPDYDNEIEDKLRSQESMEYLIQLGLQGLTRALTNKGFTESAKVQVETDEFEKENNPMLGWLDSLEDEKMLLREDAGVLYRSYDVFCVENGHKSLSSPVFAKQLKREKNLESYRKTVNGKKYTLYKYAE